MDKEYKHDNQTIMREVGIPYSFLKRCNAELPVLAQFRQKKDKNKIFYSDNGLIVWREIRLLFEQGKTMRQINDHLETTIGSAEGTLENTQETTGTTSENKKPETSRGEDGSSRDHIELFINALERQASSTAEAWQKAYERSEKDAEQAQRRIAHLETQLLALPQGKTPDQIAKDIADKAGQEEALQRLAERAAQRNALWNQHNNQTGWGRKKRQAEILRKIQELDLE